MAEPHPAGAAHLALAGQAAAVLAAYQSQDADFSQLEARSESVAGRLLRYLCQPFQVTEPFTGRPGEWVGRAELLEEVATILGSPD